MMMVGCVWGEVTYGVLRCEGWDDCGGSVGMRVSVMWWVKYNKGDAI